MEEQVKLFRRRVPPIVKEPTEMSERINDGGPAFPRLAGVGMSGMSLRQWYAGQAIAGGLCRVTLPEHDLASIFGSIRTNIRREEIIAVEALRIADAMIAAEERSHG